MHARVNANLQTHHVPQASPNHLCPTPFVFSIAPLPHSLDFASARASHPFPRGCKSAFCEFLVSVPARHRAALDELLCTKGGVVVGFVPQHFVMDGSVCAGNDVNGLGFCCSGHLVHDGKWEQVCPAITLVTSSARTVDIDKTTITDSTAATAATTAATTSDATTSVSATDTTSTIDSADTPADNIIDSSTATEAPREVSAEIAVPLLPHSGATDYTAEEDGEEDAMAMCDAEGQQHVVCRV